MPLAHPKQASRLKAAQLAPFVTTNRLANPSHPNLRTHQTHPGKTGQIVCYEKRTYR
jgi:hypothetical protein